MKAHVRSVVITFCLFSGSILFGLGCRSSALSYESIASCDERGGRVEQVCVVQDVNDYTQCKLYRQACVGASISLDGLASQRQQEKEDADRLRQLGQGSTPLVVPGQLTEEEKLNAWISRLNKLDMKKRKKDSKKYAKEHPENGWLLGFWCHKGGEQDLPALYFRPYLHGVSYRDSSGDLTLFEHIVITDQYYDLWSWSFHSTSLYTFDFFRLEKHSDHEYAVVYKLDGVSSPASLGGYDPERDKAFAKQKSAEIDPAEYIQNPEVFTQCDYKPRR